MQNQLEKLTTESRNPNTMDMDMLPLSGQLEVMNNEDKKVAEAVERELPSIAKIIEQAVCRLKAGGKMIYCGAGTSGRVGVLDAVESRPTYGVGQDVITVLLAGGLQNFGEAGEAAEDSRELGIQDLADIGVTDKDLVIGLAASGRTPYVLGAVEYAKSQGAITASVCCNKGSLISRFVDLPVELDCGPEVVTGSTRLKAGTAQKMVLNMISTITMIQLGKTYQNLMVDVEPSNEKLVERWKSIVMGACGCSLTEAKNLYHASGQKAKTAIVMHLKSCGREEAETLLEKSEGSTRKALKL